MSNLAHPFGPLICTNRCLLALLFLYLTDILGLLEQRRCWLLVGLERQLCEVQGKGQGDGRDILQQLLRTPGCWPACQNVWHAECYECLAPGQFPMKKVVDEEGNVWYKQGQMEDRINHGVRGSHASIMFQCESCWMINLEGRLPEPGLDDLYVACIRRANLDALGRGSSPKSVNFSNGPKMVSE
jgi:hypothetical protein